MTASSIDSSTDSSVVGSSTVGASETAATRADPRDSELAAAVSQSWRRFLEIYEPLRPALYRFCRLTLAISIG
jgi:hypothetical protein